MTLDQFIQDCVDKTLAPHMATYVADLLTQRIEAVEGKDVALNAVRKYAQLIHNRFPQNLTNLYVK
jgi:hypothetical protein